MTDDYTSLRDNTIKHDIARTEHSVVQSAKSMSSATLHEAAGQIGALPSVIQAATPGLRACGAAITVHMPGGDNLWLHRAIYVAQPGDILVVYASDAYDYGYWGEIMSVAAKARELGGLVIDGCVRDSDQLAEIGIPIFSRGLCIRGTSKDHDALGWVNAPILLGDVIVRPGDLILGDGDGVVAIPRERAAEVVRVGQERESKEAEVICRLQAGRRTLDEYQF